MIAALIAATTSRTPAQEAAPADDKHAAPQAYEVSNGGRAAGNSSMCSPNS